MGRLSWPAPLPSNGIKSTILYARGFRTQVAFLLPLIVLMNFGIFVMCCVAAGSIGYVQNRYRDYYGYRQSDATSTAQSSNYSTFKADLFFFFVPIPLAIWINSMVDLYKRYRRTLQPVRVVVSAVVSFTFYGIAAGLWSPCIYPPWDYRDGDIGYCPFASNPDAWDWIGADASPPSSYYVIPWLLLPAAVLYLIYLGFGASALHYMKREKRINNTVTYRHEMYPEQYDGYKMTANVYTEPYLTPDSLPTTLPSQVMSPPLSPRPPSYTKSTGGPSRSASSYYSDSKTSRASHVPCTCQCAHHH